MKLYGYFLIAGAWGVLGTVAQFMPLKPCGTSGARCRPDEVCEPNENKGTCHRARDRLKCDYEKYIGSYVGARCYQPSTCCNPVTCCAPGTSCCNTVNCCPWDTQCCGMGNCCGKYYACDKKKGVCVRKYLEYFAFLVIIPIVGLIIFIWRCNKHREKSWGGGFRRRKMLFGDEVMARNQKLATVSKDNMMSPSRDDDVRKGPPTSSRKAPPTDRNDPPRAAMHDKYGFEEPGPSSRHHVPAMENMEEIDLSNVEDPASGNVNMAFRPSTHSFDEAMESRGGPGMDDNEDPRVSQARVEVHSPEGNDNRAYQPQVPEGTEI